MKINYIFITLIIVLCYSCASEGTKTNEKIESKLQKQEMPSKQVSQQIESKTSGVDESKMVKSKEDIPIAKPADTANEACDEIVKEFEKIIKSLNAGEETAIENLEKILQNPTYSKCSSIGKYASQLKDLDKMIK